MRNAINTTANVTTNAIVNRSVCTVMAGVDVVRASSSHHLRLYAASAPQRWSAAYGLKPFAGKLKPTGKQTSPGHNEQLSRC
jgi:hypothetical protein